MPIIQHAEQQQFPDSTGVFAAVCVCVLPAHGWVGCTHAPDARPLHLGCLFMVLLANCLQSVKGAFDIAYLRSQVVYGLHGTIQLLAASH